jgi:hypothetical protein
MSRTRRGLALLLVLATLVIVVPALALLSARAAALSRTYHQNQLSGCADASLPSIQARIEVWLVQDSTTVVLPLESMQPALVVDQISWMYRGQPAAVQITAFDLMGMLSVRTTRNTPLGQHVYRQYAADLRRVPLDQANSLGLDGWARMFSMHSETSWYPSMAKPPTPGALIAFDLPSNYNTQTLNMNTTPWTLIQAVAQYALLGSLEPLALARKRGEHTTSPSRETYSSVRTTPPGPANEHAPRLVSSSTAWAFRVDFTSGSAARSWWLVYTQHNDGWRCIRRVTIES